MWQLIRAAPVALEYKRLPLGWIGHETVSPALFMRQHLRAQVENGFRLARDALAGVPALPYPKS